MTSNEYENVNNSLRPLEQWYCDVCGEVIEKVEDGWLEWYKERLNDGSFGKEKEYRIVHHDKSCMYNSNRLYKDNKMNADMHLHGFVGPDGLVSLLSKIQFDDVENNRELVEIIRRLHVPFYEEARQYHDIAQELGYFDGENEITRYIQNTSIHILNNFKGQK